MKDQGMMRAARIVAPRRIEIEPALLPQPGPGEVRIRIEGCGVCGSNLDVWRGLPGLEYPLASGAPGHEAWGRVDALGDGVAGIRCGARVAFLSWRAFAEYDVADNATLVTVPNHLQIFPGEALGCALNIFRRCDIRREHTVALIGVGFLGALLIQLAARTGARVLALSRRDFSLATARRFGAAETLRLDKPEKAIAAAMELTGGRGCARVIEAAGTQESLDVASALVAVRGRLIIAGYHQDGPRQINLQSWNWRGIDVINAHERDPQRYVAGMRAAADQITDGALDPSTLYTHSFSLDQCAAAFEALEARPAGFVKAWIRTEATAQEN
jgi:threonine dehydrogenase-like Zn-dependent dehydrogenase